MSKDRRSGKNGKKTSSGKPPRAVTPAQNNAADDVDTVFGKSADDSKASVVANHSVAGQVDGSKTRIADVADRKNIELRWLSHFTAARKAILARDFSSAVIELQSSVRFAEKLEDYRLANSLSELGYVSLQLNEFESARTFFNMAVKARITTCGANDPSIAVEYNNIAMTYEWNKDFVSAKSYLAKAVNILEEHGQFDSANFAEPYESLASICLAHGEVKKAEQLCLKAIQIRDEVLGRLHPLSMNTVQLLVQIHRASKNDAGIASARAVYMQRLQEYANSTTMNAASQALKKLLDTRENANKKEPYDNCIGDFVKLMARP